MLIFKVVCDRPRPIRGGDSRYRGEQEDVKREIYHPAEDNSLSCSNGSSGLTQKKCLYS